MAEHEMAAKMMRNLKRRAEKASIDPSLLEGWNAHITSVNEAGQAKGYYSDPEGNHYSARAEVFDRLRELHNLDPPVEEEEGNSMSHMDSQMAPSSKHLSAASPEPPPARKVRKVLDKQSLVKNARMKYEIFQKKLAQNLESLSGLNAPSKPSGVMLGPMLVEKIGIIDPLNKLYHSERYIFPRGFRAKRLLPTGDGTCVKATVQIGEGPKFSLICENQTDGKLVMIKGNSDKDVMLQAADKLKSPSIASLPFLPPEVMEVIEGLEGAPNCVNYKYINSERTVSNATSSTKTTQAKKKKDVARGRSQDVKVKSGKGKQADSQSKRKRSLSEKKKKPSNGVADKQLVKQHKKEEAASMKERKAEEKKLAAETKKRQKEAETEEKKRAREWTKKMKLKEEQERKLFEKHRGALLKLNRERRRQAQDKVNQRFFVDESSSTVNSGVLTEPLTSFTGATSFDAAEAPRLGQHLPQDIGAVLVVWNFLHCFSAPLGIRAMPHWSELYDAILVLSGEKPCNIANSFKPMNQSQTLEISNVEVKQEATVVEAETNMEEKQAEIAETKIEEKQLEVVTSEQPVDFEQPNMSTGEASMTSEKSESNVPGTTDNLDDETCDFDVQAKPPSSEGSFRIRAEALFCEVCMSLVNVSLSHLEEIDPSVKTKTYPLNYLTWPELARRCLIQFLFKQTRGVADISSLLYGPKTKNQSKEKSTVALAQQRVMAKFEEPGSQYHPKISDDSLTASRSTAIDRLKAALEKLSALQSMDASEVAETEEEDTSVLDDPVKEVKNETKPDKEEGEEDVSDEEEEEEEDAKTMLTKLHEDIDAPDVLRRIAQLLLRLFSVRGVKEIGKFQVATAVSQDEDNDNGMLISESLYYEYGIYIIAQQVASARRSAGPSRSKKSVTVSYDEGWATSEPEAVAALFTKDMRWCFAAARVYGSEMSREDILSTVERVSSIFDRLIVDWVFNGLNRSVDLINDEWCVATNSVCSISGNGSLSFKCNRCEAVYSKNAISPSPTANFDMEWFCPECLSPSEALPWDRKINEEKNEHEGSSSLVQGLNGGRWGDELGSPDVFNLLAHLRSAECDENQLISAVQLLAYDPALSNGADSVHCGWTTQERLTILEALCVCAGAGNALTKYLEHSEKLASEARRKAMDGTDESFRDALRSLGGEQAASQWQVNSNLTNRSFWVKQGFMQKTHEIDPALLVSYRLENEEKLIDAALKTALEVSGNNKPTDDTSFLALENFDKPQCVCEYCGFSEFALCSPLVHGLTREEAIRYIDLAHKPWASMVDDGEQPVQKRVCMMLGGNMVKTSVVKAPHLPRYDHTGVRPVEGPIVHEMCALVMLQQLLMSRGDQSRQLRRDVAERVIADWGCRIHPLGPSRVMVEENESTYGVKLEQDAPTLSEGMCWRFPGDSEAVFVHVSDESKGDTWLYVNQKEVLGKLASNLSEASRSILNLSETETSSFDRDASDTKSLRICTKQTMIDDEDQDEGGDVYGVALLSPLLSEEVLLPPTNVNIEEDLFNWKAQLQLRQLQTRFHFENKVNDQDMLCDPKHFISLTASSYYACVMVDKLNTHLVNVENIEVTFRVKLGKSVILEVVSAQPFDDGVYYFEAIEEFKVSGEYSLEFCASRKGSTLSPILCEVKVVAKKPSSVVSSALVNLSAHKKSDTRNDFISSISDESLKALPASRALPLSTLSALKMTLLQIQSQLPQGAQNERWNGLAMGFSGYQLDWTQTFSEKWRLSCLEAASPVDLMEALILLEASIDKEWLSGTYLSNRRNHGLSLRSATFASVALRVFELDSAIKYTKTGGRHSSRRAAASVPRGMYNEDARFAALDAMEAAKSQQSMFADPPDSRRRPRKAAVQAMASTAHMLSLERQKSDDYLGVEAEDRQIEEANQAGDAGLEPLDDEDEEVEEMEDDDDDDDDDEHVAHQSKMRRDTSKQVKSRRKLGSDDEEEEEEEGEDDEEEEEEEEEENDEEVKGEGEEEEDDDDDDEMQDDDAEDDNDETMNDVENDHNQDEDEQHSVNDASNDHESEVMSGNSDSEEENDGVDEGAPLAKKLYVPAAPRTGKFMMASQSLGEDDEDDEQIKIKCSNVLDKINELPISEPFLEPVDLTAFSDYLQYVDKPMDLTTIREQLVSGNYEGDPEAFANDVRLVWANCMKYNSEDSRIWQHASTLNTKCEQLFAEYFGGDE